VAREGSELFAILASDGVWDVISPDLASEGGGTAGGADGVDGGGVDGGADGGPCAAAARRLVDAAMERGGHDNAAAVVVQLCHVDDLGHSRSDDARAPHRDHPRGTRDRVTT